MAHLPLVSQSCLFFLSYSIPGQICRLPHVGCEHDEVVVLVDVVHDLHFEESLGSVVHDLVGKFRLSNVLSEMLDTSSSSLGSSIPVHNLIQLVFGLDSTLNLLDPHALFVVPFL